MQEDVVGEMVISIDDIIDQYGEDVWKLVFSYVQQEAVADDLTQDIFIKVYKKMHTYQGSSTIRTWIWKIAINHCNYYLKSWYKRNVQVQEDWVFQSLRSEGSIEHQIVQNDEDQKLEQEVLLLPVKYREVIYLFYYEEQSVKDISLLLQLKENTVKTRLRRAKQLLKERLVEE
ncbi:RNA polymerase factor sigma C [Bacillus coahuilensis m2-6]|uniref:sigma-70 family RNA polymerase sigma factor n=1 Tax=Bacillus coahuilensis TaxID=408580 RepID=UPI00075024F0|nr:sigma-70 family RNA polymerase sigma factor [Bacillus coahuilensis]KUP09641.1 RNA polymerase factor sigma C [Bacillus coahuilensis m2-6]